MEREKDTKLCKCRLTDWLTDDWSQSFEPKIFELIFIELSRWEANNHTSVTANNPELVWQRQKNLKLNELKKERVKI